MTSRKREVRELAINFSLIEAEPIRDDYGVFAEERQGIENDLPKDTCFSTEDKQAPQL